MQIYNSLSNSLEEFQIKNQPKIIMYVCGLTPYDDVHLGHARTYVAFDIIKRYLMKKGYSIYHIQNITDVEDKIINRAKEKNRDPLELAEEYQGKADELFTQLGILDADIYPKVSDHIEEIIEMVQKIVENGYGYISKDGVYFRTSKFKSYGKLSGQNLEKIRKGARVEINENKETPEDFALWKIVDDEMITFDSPFGKGRPGWHIECSAMAMKYSKAKTIDIHGGGRDLSFPHHENEIAQTEAALKVPFVKYWMHTGFLTVNGEKMSKSLGNFITVKDVLKTHKPNSMRLFFAHTHYKSPIDYSEDEMKATEKTIERIFESYGKLNVDNVKEDGEGIEIFEEDVKNFYKYMDDDFNTPQALASFFSLIKKINIAVNSSGFSSDTLKYLKKEVKEILDIFGFVEEKKGIVDENKLIELFEEIKYRYEIKLALKRNVSVEDIIESIISIREHVRKKKDYVGADEIRDKLKELGVILEDRNGKTKHKIN